MDKIIDRIKGPEDIKKLNFDELNLLAAEIREFMLDILSKVGGHVAPNLGSVELTLALHYVFDSPRDKLIWDVGHQAYPHKIVTGRKDNFHTIRQYGGISGFLRREESPHDIFGAGHASTSLSAALGIAVARDLKGEDFKVIAIIGDGALTGGMAFEALNNIGAQRRDLIVVLNDNEMSIAENIGALSNYLVKLKTSRIYNRMKEDVWELLGKLPSSKLSYRTRDLIKRVKAALENLAVPTLMFEELGYRYVGPIHGHNIKQLINTFERVKRLRGPVLVHVLTRKGKGYKPAEDRLELFHGLGPFHRITGEPIKKPGPTKWSKIYGKTIVELAEKDEKIVAITAAMTLGTGLDLMRERFPERHFDVGIAEQHAVTFAGGLAVEGFKPFATIYSTFLQRAYDQIIHDIALQKLPVRFAVDRAGLVGEDGPTHHGAFDISYLRIVPNMVVMAPKDENEFRDMIYTASLYDEGPIAFRYPRDRVYGLEPKETFDAIPIGSWEILKDGKDIAIMAVGTMVYPSLEAAKELEEELGTSIKVVNARFVKPMDTAVLFDIVDSGIKKIVTVEENSLIGGFGDAVIEFLTEIKRHVDVLRLGLPDKFIEHGARRILLQKVGLDKEGIKERIRNFLLGYSGVSEWHSAKSVK